MKKFKNLTKIRVKGLNQERSISKVCKENKIFNLNRIDKNLSEFEVSSTQIKKVKSQLVSQGLEVEILANKGLLSFFKKFFKNYGVIAGIIISCLLYFLSYNFVWQVKIYGNENIQEKQIVDFVNANFSKFKGNINLEEVEIALKEEFKRISSVSVSLIGQSLVININESFLPSEMEGDFSPIYAQFDCKIIDISLVQGTLNVKKGDIVQKGEILVEPYIIDSQGQKREVKPQAEITAEVWLMGEVNHSESYYQTFRTGKKLVYDQLTLFGLPIYSNGEKNQFKEFECEEWQSPLTKNNILPFILNKKIYYETQTKLIQENFQDVKEQKIQEAKQKALIYFQDCDIIKNEDVNILSNAGISNIEYIITVERKVGVVYEDLLQEGGVK